MATKLSDLPLATLREMLADTERSFGVESVSASIIRREVERRERPETHAVEVAAR
jgi:hypothetical protein